MWKPLLQHLGESLKWWNEHNISDTPEGQKKRERNNELTSVKQRIIWLKHKLAEKGRDPETVFELEMAIKRKNQLMYGETYTTEIESKKEMLDYRSMENKVQREETDFQMTLQERLVAMRNSVKDHDTDIAIKNLERLERMYRMERERVAYESDQKRSAYMLALEVILAELKLQMELAKQTGNWKSYDEADEQARERINNLKNSFGL